MMVAGSFHGTRTTGTVSVCEMACSIGHTSFMSVSPCCMSTQRASKPWRAITSAVKPWDTDSQPRVTNFPSRHICLILFGRTVAPRLLEISPRAKRSTLDGRPGRQPPLELSSAPHRPRRVHLGIHDVERPLAGQHARHFLATAPGYLRDRR